MISQKQIEEGIDYIKNSIPDVISSIDYEVQDAGDSIIFIVEFLRPLSVEEEVMCELKMKKISEIIPRNKFSPMINCECRYGHGNCNYSFLGFDF